MKTEEIIIKRKQGNNKKSDLEQRKKELLKDVVSYVKSEESVGYKRQVQELYWKHRKKGLKPKEAWEQAKRDITILKHKLDSRDMI